jgi:N-methylhydantoinase A
VTDLTDARGLAARYRIGIDVGGTFTDFVFANTATGALSFHKEPSVPNDPSVAVERGIAAILAAHHVAPEQVDLLCHGTTIGLNAIIQRRGARTALVVSRGNRDILEIARLRLPSSYDFTEPREAPLIPRDLVFELDARMTSRGEITEMPTDAAIDALADQLAAEGVEAVAITFLNAYRDARLEVAVATRLRARLPGVLIVESGVLWPEVREYERCLLVALNAFIRPMMTAYFDRLATRMAGLGLHCPIYITANNGGTLSLDTARDRPIDTILSGPASGVVASTRVAGTGGQPRIVTFDMGGTSADISICHSGVPEFTASTFVGDFPIMMPVVNILAIGAGGGSIIWVDAQGVLKVGPLSAGADPGPACYGRGGTQATVTDCYLALGILDPGAFLDGRMRLDRVAARAALDTVADRLGITGADRALAAAEAALRVATAKMATEIVKMLAHAGADMRDYWLLGYGGAGATHACMLADEAQLAGVLVPLAPGTFCALGALLADVRRDYVRTARHSFAGPTDGTGWTAIRDALSDMEAQARDWIAREGDLVGAHRFEVTARMRYPSQAYELEIPIPEDRRAGMGAADLADLFHAEHDKLYGFAEPDSALVTSTLRLAVIGTVAPVALPDAATIAPAPRARRAVRWRGAEVDAAVYRRADIGQGAVIDGPAVVEQPDTTTFILPGWRARADRIGTLHLTRITRT